MWTGKQRDRHEEPDSGLLQFCESPYTESDQSTIVTLCAPFPVSAPAIKNVLPSRHEDARSEVLTAMTLNISFF
jgi:hypothetical protein